MADPVSVVKDFDEAWNAHDIEGVLAFFTDDAVVRMEPAPPDQAVYLTNRVQPGYSPSSRTKVIAMLTL